MVVEEVLRHFDQQRYLLLSAVVMPNHVHLLSCRILVIGWKGFCEVGKPLVRVALIRLPGE